MISNEQIYLISTIEGMKIIWFEVPLKSIKNRHKRKWVSKLRDGVKTYEFLTGRKVDKEKLLKEIWLNDCNSQKEFNSLKSE